MKCKYGKDNMVLSKDEFLWHCPHCGYEKFAPRSAYNFLKKEAKRELIKGTTIGKFIDKWTCRDIALKAIAKVIQEEVRT